MKRNALLFLEYVAYAESMISRELKAARILDEM